MSWNPPLDYDQAWYEIDKSEPTELASCLIRTVQDIETRQTSIFQGNQRHARIYAGYIPNGLAWSNAPGTNNRMPFAATKALVRSVCDTATALISKFRPKATFITTGASWDVQKQAEDMDLFCAGAFERSNIYQVYPRSFHDSTVFGTGAWKLVPRGKGDKWKVVCERVLPDDLIVDEDECREHLEPENIYHRVIVRIDALIRKYCKGNSERATKARSAILAAGNITSWPNRTIPKDRCIVVEAFHIDENGDSRRVVAIENHVLEDEPWPYDWHPFVVLHWAPPISGFYGDGVAYRQYGRQERISYMYRWIQRCHDLFATPKAWVDPVGGPPVLSMSNEIGAVIQTRKPPVFQTHAVIPPEIYAWVDNLAAGGYEDEGVNQMTAASQLPTGIESAPAQREYSFKESNRFAPVSARLEHAVAVETATKMIAMYRRRAEATKEEGLKMQWADRKTLYQVSWPELDENAYHIRAAASSLESLSPASRLQAAIELAQTGWLRNGEGRALLGHPDLERSDDLANSGTNYAEMVLKRLLKGEFVEVDEYADLVILDQVVRQGRLLAVTRGAPQDLIDNCSDFLDRVDNTVSNANAAVAAQSPQLSDAAAAGQAVPFSAGPG